MALYSPHIPPPPLLFPSEHVLSRMLASEPSFENAEACMEFASAYGVATRLLRPRRDLVEAAHQEQDKGQGQGQGQA
jgi:hypothetical protein